MPRRSFRSSSPGMAIVVVAPVLLLGSGGVVLVLSTHQVSNTSQTAYRWEPSAGVGITWAHSWAEFPVSNLSAFASFVSTWNGSSWRSPAQLTAPSGQQQGDVNIAWDSYRGRFVFTTLDGPGGNVWYGYSTDGSGTSWVFKSTPVFSSSRATWDYPSIGVDASGRIVVGAVSFAGPSGYFASVSTDGANFTEPSLVANPGSGNGGGARSRAVATNNTFQAFVPTLNTSFNPTSVNRYQSSDGVNWTGPFNVATFSPPLNNSPNSPFIFYANLLAATGYTNGLWAVAVQINNGGFNNVYFCTSNRGCGIANSAADDQFLNGVSVSGDQGYWISYLTFSTLQTRQLPLITQALYFASGKNGVGATTNTGIQPTSWLLRSDRCTMPCYAAGDFNTVSSNPYASATTPFVSQDSRQTDLFQSFTEDPQAVPSVPNFVPNFVPYAMGSDLTFLGVLETSLIPTTAALPPGNTIGAALH